MVAGETAGMPCLSAPHWCSVGGKKQLVHSCLSSPHLCSGGEV